MICRLLGVEDPQTADPERSWLTFEQGARKARGGSGWADVWRRGCFGWECMSRGPEGDAVNAMLSAIGHNCRLLLAWFRQLLLRLVLDMIRRLFAMLPPGEAAGWLAPGTPVAKALASFRASPPSNTRMPQAA